MTWKPRRFAMIQCAAGLLSAGIVASLPGVAAAQTSDSRALAAAEGLEQVITSAIDACAPSVVAIAQDRRRRDASDRPSPFDFDPAGLRRTNPRSADFVPTYFGSGVVVDRAGLVLTNYHVLGFDNEDYQVDHYVTTADRKVYRARIKGADPRSDLAVLELIEPEANAGNTAKAGNAAKTADTKPIDLKPISLGNGGAVRRGAMVVALGNPYAIARDGQASAGWGIVANVNRKAPASAADEEIAAGGKTTVHHYGGLIQTDARLNLGTSGGALINLRGEMIGLTTSIAAQVGYETPAGYAIAVDDVFRRALDALKAGREVEYGFLGVQPAQLEDDLPRDGSEPTEGVRVDRLVRGGPGERAGLRRDDWITAVDGRAVFDADSLVLSVTRFAPEAKVRLSVVRAGRPSELVADLTKGRVVGRRVVSSPSPQWRGLRVDYPAALVPAHELIEIPTGVVAIRSIEPESQVAHAGLSAGLLVSHVAGKPIANPAEFHRAVASLSGDVEVTGRGPDGQPRTFVVAE
jgi:serine protease Do